MRPPLILASTSAYRRTLLERLGLAFQVVPPGVVETARPAEHAAALAARLAREKAVAVARRHPDAIVLGSDQVCTLDGQILGKPATEERARAQLMQASARQVDFLTAVAVVRDGGAECLTHLDRTRVRFRKLDAASVRDYVAREQPLDCAGSFRCEALGIALFESVTSDDPTALVGLPLIAVTTLLGKVGVHVLG